ncbi:MAG: GNAT family N-acetyltransferase [Oscillospiraceae bacterium]|nr:GNAT family N-acetyltransferase [Oscillospiraceae bacterium]
MAQLRMLKQYMADIPGPNVQSGLVLRVIRQDEKGKWEELCSKAFNAAQSYQSIIVEKTGYVEDGVFVIADGDRLVATGTAICDHAHPEGFGYVHMIAADSDYAGRKLGFEITAAVLRRLRDDGFATAELTTDDFRLPAIKVYRSLGFIPDLTVDGTMRGRWEAIYEIFGWGLDEYIG